MKEEQEKDFFCISSPVQPSPVTGSPVIYLLLPGPLSFLSLPNPGLLFPSLLSFASSSSTWLFFTACMYFDINVCVCQCPPIPYSDSVASPSDPFFYLMPNFTLLLSLFCFSLVTITFLPPLGDRGQLSKRQTYATVHTPYFF